MASEDVDISSSTLDILRQIQATLHTIQCDYRQLSATVKALDGRIDLAAGIQRLQGAADREDMNDGTAAAALNKPALGPSPPGTAFPRVTITDEPQDISVEKRLSRSVQGQSTPSRIILTTYPGQSGIDPIPMSWGHSDPRERGPVVVSRSQSTVRRRNGKSEPFLLRPSMNLALYSPFWATFWKENLLLGFPFPLLM